MGYSKYVGRIGALAVALGIGTAVAQPAWAETPSNDTETSSKPAESGTPAGNEPAGRTGPNGPAPGANEPAGPALDNDDNDDDDDDESNLEDEELENLDEGDEDLDPADKLTEEPSSGYTEQPPLTNTTPDPIAPSDPPEPNTPLRQDASSRTSEESTEENLGSEANLFAYQSNNEDTGAETDDIIALSLTGPSTLDFSTDAIPTVPSPAPIQNQPDNPIEIVIGTAGKLINIAAGAIGMLFSPIFTPGYNGPGGLALVFATLDMVRRELDRAFSNSSPTAVADLATTSELVPTTIAVLANDVDPNLGQGDILTVVGYTQASNGTVVLNSNGSFTYTPNAGFSGVDTFTYTISDDASPWHIHGLAGLFGRGGHASTAAVTITVGEAPVNVAPVARPDSATITQGSGPTTINVLGNDNDADNDPLTITDVTQPENGTVTFTTTGVSYAPDETFAGTDSFTYTVSDGTTTTVGTVTVTVIPVIVVNAPPTAVDDNASTAEDTTINIDVTANDTDPEGDPLQLTAVSSAGHGTVAINGATVTYTPNPDWHGIDTFTYTISDGEHEDTATVTVVVIPVNESPVANDDSVSLPQGSGSTLIDVLANDTDADNAPTPLQVTGVTQPANGTVVPSSTGLSYTPNTGFSGTDTFTYTITDGTSFDSATVTVTVTPVNQPPQLVIGDVEVDDDGVVTGLITVTDPDGPTLTVTPPVIDEGDVTVTNLGGGVFGFTFTPTQEAHETAWATIGDDTVSLTFTVSDGVAAAVSASVLAPITPVEPTTDPGGEYEAIDLADLDSLTGITVTVDGQVYVIGKGALDFDGDGGSDYTGYVLGTVDTADQTFTPVVPLTDSVQPFDIAVGPNGRIFVADVATGVTAYDPANGYLPTTVLAGPAVQVAFGNDKLYVTAFDFNPETATSSGRLYIFDSDLTQVGAPIALEDPSFGLAIGPTGNLYLTSLDFSANPTQPTDGKLSVLNGDGGLLVRVATTGVTPYGVTVDHDGIAYVTDPLRSTIYAVDPFGRGIIGTLEAPAGSLALDIGPDGLLYVPNQISRSIVVLDPSDLIIEPGGGQELNADIDVFAENIGTSAIGLALDGNGGLYVTDLGLRISENGEQLPGTGTIIYLGPDGLPAGNPLSINGNPWGVAVGNGGLLYVSDYASGTIWVVDAAAQSVEEFVSVPGQGATLATDGAGNVYVIGFEAPSELEEFSTFTLHIFDAAGSETGTLPASGPAFAVTADGKIYIPISDGSGSATYTEIRVLNTDGTEAAPAISLGAFSPASMAFGADGTLYIAGFDAANTGGGPSTQAELIVIDPRGTMTAPVSLGSVIPWSLVVDGDSAIYFSDSTTGTIYRVTLSGLPADTNSAPEVGDPAFDVTGIGALGSVRGHVNVEDPDGDPLSYTLTPGSVDTAVGTVSVDVHGNWIFTPTAQARVDAASTEGEDNTTFSLTVSDGLETIVVPITVTIRPKVAAPVAQSPAYTINNVDKYTGVVTGVVHVIDLDDPVLLYTVTTNGNGAVTVQDDGSFTYTPNSKARQLASLTPGEDAATFTITATDGFHAPATITVEAAITPATDFALSALYGGEQESWGNQSVAVGTDGRIYFTTYLADDTVGEVVVLNADGTYATTVSIADVVGYPFASAYDVVVGDDGRVFVSSEVADTLEDLSAEAGRGVIVVIDPDNDYATSQFAELADPASALAVDSTGRLYVANWNNDNITVLNVDGSVHRVIQSEPLFEGDDSGVAGLAISGSGLLYLTKPGLGAIKVVNQNGTTADVFEVGGAPWAIAVNAVGHLFVSDFGSSSVVELDQAGAVVRSIALAQDVQASDVTVAEDGTVYVPYLGSNGASIAIITAVSGLPDGGIQHGPEITGTPVMVSTSTLAVGNAVYQSTVSTGSGTGLVTTTLTLVRADGSSTSVQGTGETYGDITAGPNGVVYQTLTYTDPASGDRQSGVLVIASDGTGYFTGLRSGIPIGPVVSGDNATYQIIYRHDEQNSAYTTTVLAIVDGVVFDHEVSGIPGGPISGASNAVVAPDGTVYLTVTDIPSDSLDYSGATTSVVILSADGLTSHTTAGFAGGPVTIASDGTVYQSLGIAHLDSETGDTTFTAAVAVLEGTGLVARPETVTGIPIGGIVVRPDGSALLTVVILDDSEGSESGASSTLLVEVTENGLTALIEPVAGTPIALDGSWLPAVVDSDGVAYLTTSASNSESDSTTTTVTVLQRDGAIELWTMSGQPVGGVVPGSAGTVYQTTYDSTTDITRIAAITASGSDTHTLAGYPGNSDTVGKPSGPVVGPDGNAYLTVSSKNSATGGYSTTVAVVSSNGVASWSFNGLPSSSVVFDSNGVAHQATYEFDFARQIHVTTVFTVTPNGTSQVGEALLGHPNGSVVFGSDGAVYVSVSQQGGAGTTTVHALIAPASDQPLVQRNTTTSEPGRSPAFSLASNSTNPYIRVIDTAYLRPFITADPTGRFFYTSYIKSLRGLTNDVTPISESYAKQLADVMQQQYGSHGFASDSQGRLVYRNTYSQDVLVVFGPRSDNLAPVGAILVRAGTTETLPASEDGRFAASQRIGQQGWDAFVYRGATPVQETKPKSSTKSTQPTYSTTTEALAKRIKELYLTKNAGSDSIRVDRVSSSDGTNRLVVYITGIEFTIESIQNAWDVRVNGYKSSAVQKILQAYNEVPYRTPSETMLVGHSKGGMIAQLIAQDSRWREYFNVTAVVTFGSPRVTPLIHVSGLNYQSIHLESQWDVVSGGALDTWTLISLNTKTYSSAANNNCGINLGCYHSMETYIKIGQEFDKKYTYAELGYFQGTKIKSYPSHKYA